MRKINITTPHDKVRLRRLALSSQGLLRTQPFGRGVAGTRKAVNHLGYVQVDTISVVERAHHHVLYSRVPGFKPDMIHQLLRTGAIFEYWAHAAAFLPIDDFRYSLPYKYAIKNGKTHWYKHPDRKLMNELWARIRSEGPLRSRDLETGTKKRAGWWDWKPAKKALEQMYMQGDLMVSDRDGFQKIYDLTERVLPSGVNTTMPNVEEYAAHLLNQQLRCHGFASLKGVTYLRRDPELRKAVKALVDEGLAQRTLEEVQLDGGEAFIMEAGALERPLPRLNDRLLIVSPFDNSVIQRDRLKAVFQYDYQIECYTPEAKRRYGYFCLPLLFRDAFIGRMDCKAHRKDRHLEIKSLHLEKHHFDQERIIAALAKAIPPFCRFQQCDSVSITQAYPKDLTRTLRSQINSLL